MRSYSHVALLTALALGGCDSEDSKNTNEGNEPRTAPIDRSGLNNLGTAPLDYSDPNLWACRPGNAPNECDTNLDATETRKDNTQQLVRHVRATKPSFDCFYVYPTVSLGGSGNVTDFSDIDLVRDPLFSQGAPFTSICEVYAPLYRQVSLGGGGDAGISASGDPALGIKDVEDAFQYYLDHLSKSRDFVLIGHSQGTFALTQLIKDKIDADAALRGRMISALLIGGAVNVPEGQRVGGSFQNVPSCASPGETGCVIAYNAFAKEAPPPANTAFGKAAAGSEIVCTTPGPLANNPGRFLGSYLPQKIRQPAFIPDGTPKDSGITTPFALYRDFFRGECSKSNGVHYLEISVDKAADDQRPVPPYRNSITEGIGFGLHVSDFNLAIDDLIEAVRLQAAAKK